MIACVCVKYGCIPILCSHTLALNFCQMKCIRLLKLMFLVWCWNDFLKKSLIPSFHKINRFNSRSFMHMNNSKQFKSHKTIDCCVKMKKKTLGILLLIIFSICELFFDVPYLNADLVPINIIA